MIKFSHKILSSIVKNSKIKNLFSFSLVYCPPQGLIFNIKNKNNPIYASCSSSEQVSFISL